MFIILGSIDFGVRRAAASREERNRSRQSGDHGLFHDISRSGGRDSDPWNGSACRTSAKLDLFVESFADLLQLVGGIFFAGELRLGIAVPRGICTRRRSAERRVGKECVSPWCSWGADDGYKKKIINNI